MTAIIKLLFQSTLPRGERPTTERARQQLDNFNPRSHEGSDARKPTDKQLFKIFQSTLPRGERQKPKLRYRALKGFQSTLPRGERPCRSQEEVPRMVYFNPRSHEGSDGAVKRCVLPDEISIHAPTRGATLLPMFDNISDDISIHAPTRGATIDRGHIHSHFIVFQSTLPRGERRLRPMVSSAIFQFQSTLPRGERP